MPEKHFGPGFADKHFADKHFAGDAEGGGDVTIEPADCLHVHIADASAVSESGDDYLIGAQNALHAHAATASALTQNHVIQPASCTHAHTATSSAVFRPGRVPPRARVYVLPESGVAA